MNDDVGALLLGLAGVALVGGVAYAVYRLLEGEAPSPASPGRQPGCPGQQPGATPEPVPGPAQGCPAAGHRVLLIGDSYAAGLGPPMDVIARACGTPFQHHGVVGSHVTQWTGWVDADLSSFAPTVVLLSMGGNDYQRTDPENVQAAVRELARKIRASGARLLWIGPLELPFADRIGVQDMWKAEVGSDWFDSKQLVLPRAPDGVHSTPAGYAVWSTHVWEWMAARIGPVSR